MLGYLRHEMNIKLFIFMLSSNRVATLLTQNWTTPLQRTRLVFHEHTMALKSKFPDVAIPEGMSWPEFVFQNFDKFGDTTAIVSTNKSNYNYVLNSRKQDN